LLLSPQAKLSPASSPVSVSSGVGAEDRGSGLDVHRHLCAAIGGQTYLPPKRLTLGAKDANTEALRRLDRRTLYNAIFHELSGGRGNQTAAQGAMSSMRGSKVRSNEERSDEPTTQFLAPLACQPGISIPKLCPTPLSTHSKLLPARSSQWLPPNVSRR